MVDAPFLNTSPARAALVPKIWDDNLFREYIRSNQFSRYMSRDPNAVIQVQEDLTRQRGDRVVFAAMRKLIGAGVTGSTALRGAEELLDLRSMEVTVDVLRHAVAVNDWDEQKSVHSLRDLARPALRDWSMERMRDDIITALTSVNGVALSAANATQRNEWMVDNADRIQFGSAVANAVSGVFLTAAALIDNTNDRMSAAVLSMAKRRARKANPAIRPVRVNGDQEWYVAFMPSEHFRDFRADPAVKDAQQLALERGRDNPLFTGGDLIWDGVIVREIPEMDVLADLGAGGTVDIAATALVGAQALGVAWAQRLQSRTETEDYGFQHGVAVQEIRGIQKLRFGTNSGTDTGDLKDHGVYTIFAAAEPDA